MLQPTMTTWARHLRDAITLRCQVVVAREGRRAVTRYYSRNCTGTGGGSRRGHRSYPVRMSDPLLPPQESRAAAAAYAELGPAYSDAVVASFLERVDQEIAARVGARLAGMGQPEPPAGLDHRRNLLKGVGAAVSGIAVQVIGGSPGARLPGLLWMLFDLLVVCAVGADWAGRHRGGCASVRTGPQVGQG
jgi:hypothetical protein